MTTNSPAAAGVRSAGSRLAIMAAVTATIVAIGWLGLRLVPGLYDGIWNFVLDGQREMTKGMTGALRQLKTVGSVNAALILGFISFIYGVLHAVGPGHGKFVISSYALANERTVRRGILLSFMAALIQALSAIVLVGILAMILKATSLQIKAAENWLETASWGLIALLGAWLLWTRLRGDHHHHHAGHAAGEPHHPQPDHGHAHGAHDACCAGGHHHDHGHVHAHGAACAHDHEPGHVHDEHCGHTHMATPQQLQGPWSWSHAWSLAFSIGIRPCTGAIGVLLLSLSLGIMWAGIFATFTMAIGTALTVSALASLAVGSRELAKKLAGGAESHWAASIQQFAAIGGSALVMVIGATFFLASLLGGPRL